MSETTIPARPLDERRLGREDALVDSDWLTEHLTDPLVRVVEVDVDPRSYDAGHIDGSVLWNIYADLKDEDHRPVHRAAFERLVSDSGINSESTVVLYGYGPALGFWLLKLYGHHDVRILDAARDTWRTEGRPWTTTRATPEASGYRLGNEDSRLRATRQDVQEATGDGGGALLDVRSEAEFRGERFWPSGGMEPGGQAGHVPGATHVPLPEVHDERGAFLSRDELALVLQPREPDAEGLITYCTIGSRASTAWFVLTYLLGLDDVRVYDGSWAEWGRLVGMPVEQ